MPILLGCCTADKLTIWSWTADLAGGRIHSSPLNLLCIQALILQNTWNSLLVFPVCKYYLRLVVGLQEDGTNLHNAPETFSESYLSNTLMLNCTNEVHSQSLQCERMMSHRSPQTWSNLLHISVSYKHVIHVVTPLYMLSMETLWSTFQTCWEQDG